MENDEIFKLKLMRAIEADDQITAAGLSLRAGLDKSTIRNLFNGKTRSVKLDTARKICEAMGTTLQEFMDDGNQLRDRLTAQESEILRLVNQLPEPLRQQLLGYAQALATPPGSPRPEIAAKYPRAIK